MGEKCGVLEVTKTTSGYEKSDDFELSLELSIGGGKYGKSEKIEGPNHNNDNYCGSLEPVGDLHRRKEIQAFFRRQEARRKREEKLKRPRRVGLFEEEDNNNNNNNKQRLQPGVGDRGTREIYGFIGGEIRNNGNDELGLSLFTENKNVEIRDCLLYPKVQYLPPLSYGYGEGETVSISNGSLERSSSAVSDYQSTPHKGGTSSDTGSHSTPSRLNQHHSISRNEFDQHLESNGSSCQNEPDRHLGGRPPTRVAPSSNSHSSRGPFSDKPKVVSTDESRPDQPNNNVCSTSYNRSPPRPEQTIGGGPGGDKSVEPVKMPCVSTTGNGPNGRTVRGFLYKYTKTEVSIVCVCHGSSFSPAGFVEHAGGVDISHPLKHITIVPTAFG
ncbi:hypothetical protein OROHE_007313 [Orobanche hederae]